MSRRMHPDKAKQSFIASRAKATSKPKTGQKNQKPSVHVNKTPSEREIQAEVKKASERYARLGVVTEILKGSGRERYDYFLSNGFPSWRGTGYYYARFRPGLGTVLVGLFAFGGGLVHYGAMYLGWKRRRTFVKQLIQDSRKAAWGDDSGIRGIPGVDGALDGTSAAPPSQTFARENGAAMLNRRQKRMQEKENKKEDKKSKVAKQSGTNTPVEIEPDHGPQGVRRKVQAPNGKVMIVDSVGNVYLEEEDENGTKHEFLLDLDELPQPTFEQTVLFRLPVWTYSILKSWITGVQANHEQAEIAGLGTNNYEKTDAVGSQTLTNGSTRKRGKKNGKLHA